MSLRHTQISIKKPLRIQAIPTIENPVNLCKSALKNRVAILVIRKILNISKLLTPQSFNRLSCSPLYPFQSVIVLHIVWPPCLNAVVHASLA